MGIHMVIGFAERVDDFLGGAVDIKDALAEGDWLAAQKAVRRHLTLLRITRGQVAKGRLTEVTVDEIDLTAA